MQWCTSGIPPSTPTIDGRWRQENGPKAQGASFKHTVQSQKGDPASTRCESKNPLLKSCPLACVGVCAHGCMAQHPLPPTALAPSSLFSGCCLTALDFLFPSFHLPLKFYPHSTVNISQFASLFYHQFKIPKITNVSI